MVQRLTAALGDPEGEPRRLEGLTTNRNYLVTLGGQLYVVRVRARTRTSLGSIARASAGRTRAPRRSGFRRRRSSAGGSRARSLPSPCSTRRVSASGP